MIPRTLCILLLIACLTTAGIGQVLRTPNRIPLSVQDISEDRLDLLANAIAKAEGFSIKHAVPTRYHNPGDIRSHSKMHYPGQVGLATKNHYVVFKNDQAGFAALKDLILKIIAGQSRHYSPYTSVSGMAKSYAGNWRQWSKNVCRELSIPDSISLRDYLMPRVEAPIFRTEMSFPDTLMVVTATAPRQE